MKLAGWSGLGKPGVSRVGAHGFRTLRWDFCAGASFIGCLTAEHPAMVASFGAGATCANLQTVISCEPRSASGSMSSSGAHGSCSTLCLVAEH